MRTRDGVTLRSDVYRPEGDGPYPSLLLRTPYGKHDCEHEPSYDFARFVEAGYLVICQDVRGRFASDGEWQSFLRAETSDAADGYDAVEWAARLPAASGKVGTFGASYDGFLQWRTAAARPPSLVAMSAQSIPARYPDLEAPGALRPGQRLHWWITKMAPESRRRSGRPGTHSRSEAEAAWDAGEGANWLRFLPVSGLPREVFEEEADAVQAWLRAPHTDPWQLAAGHAGHHRPQPRLHGLVRPRRRRHGDVEGARPRRRERDRAPTVADRDRSVEPRRLRPVEVRHDRLRGGGAARWRRPDDPLVRPLAQRRGERGRRGAAGADLRHGRQLLARRRRLAPGEGAGSRAVHHQRRARQYT